MLRSYEVFGGSGPILVLTHLEEGMQGDQARTALANKGYEKYIAFEVPTERVAERFGTAFIRARDHLDEKHPFEVVTDDGPHVFNRFNFTEMGEPVFVGEGLQ